MLISDRSSDVFSYDLARAEGTGARIAGAGGVEAAAVERLGRRGAERRAARLCRERRALSARDEGGARRPSGARGAHGAGTGLFRFPADARGARPRGLARGRYLRASLMSERRSEERRDGKAGVSTGISRWSAYHS